MPPSIGINAQSPPRPRQSRESRKEDRRARGDGEEREEVPAVAPALERRPLPIGPRPGVDRHRRPGKSGEAEDGGEAEALVRCWNNSVWPKRFREMDGR